MSGQQGSAWVQTTKGDESILTDPLNMHEDLVPNVREMGVKDAVYLLENAGLKVVVRGRGKVMEQSISHGSKIVKGQKIVLTMSFFRN
jgi:cell division protein FtsI (penicillin-binding protein 3)